MLEKNRKPAVKILMSGGTRCNLTHATDNRGIVAAYGPPGRFLHSALAAFSVQDTLDFFEAEGVATKVEETGKVFPVSNKAMDVLQALLRRLRLRGAELALEEPLRDVQPRDNGFTLTTSTRVLEARQRHPHDRRAILSRLRHDRRRLRLHVPPGAHHRPAAPGPRADHDRGTVDRGTAGHYSAGYRSAHPQRRHGPGKRRGSLLFAHFGLSGPVILDVSRVVSGHPRPSELSVELDFLPGMTEETLDEWLRVETAAAGKKQLAAVLAGILPRRLSDALVVQSGLPMDRRAAALSRPERSRLVMNCKRLPLPVTGTLGFGKAEVTAGGVALEEVDSRNMQSKRVPGLFIAGELLDLDGPIGGYNFQAAWSTGWLAGQAAAE